MDDRSNAIQIRHPETGDEPALIRICHITGDTRVNPALFGVRWCLDYTRHEPENCFVAVDAGKVVGYIVGTLDSAEQAARFKRESLPEVERLYRSLQPKTLYDWRHVLFLRYFDLELFKALYAEFPAHLHINLDPAYQRRGIGRQLLAAYEGNLRRLPVSGYHLEVGGGNRVGISFYQKMGLAQLGVFPGFGKPLVIAYGRKLQGG